jgi:hypothetical protein
MGGPQGHPQKQNQQNMMPNDQKFGMAHSMV